MAKLEALLCHIVTPTNLWGGGFAATGNIANVDTDISWIWNRDVLSKNVTHYFRVNM